MKMEKNLEEAHQEEQRHITSKVGCCVEVAKIVLLNIGPTPKSSRRRRMRKTNFILLFISSLF